MSSRPDERSGGQILVDVLQRHGVRRVFCVPGESYLPVLDALYDAPDIQLITCRQEGGAAFMAEADGRMSGQPGVCLATRGPGATNASIGVHAAFQASTPMLLVIGQVPRTFLGREAFQELDLVAMFSPLAKWAVQVPSADRMHEYVERAWRLAMSGRPGPVVLVTPEDVLSENCDYARPHPHSVEAVRYRAPVDAPHIMGMLSKAERPLVIVGGGGWGSSASENLAIWAENNRLPVAADFRCQDYLDNESPSYVGDLGMGANPALVRRLKEADVLIVLGSRLGEIATQGYASLAVPQPQQTLVHIHSDPDTLGAVYQPDLGIVATSRDALESLAASENVEARWTDWTSEARADLLAWRTPVPSKQRLDLASAVAEIDDILPLDAIITNGAGNYTAWVHRFGRFRMFGTQLAPASGAMGYGLPAAIAAKLHHPSRPVVAFAGDGCLLMTGQELATAVRYGLHIVVIVVNNGMYGTIRMHQELRYPGRISGSDITNPDFVAYARSFGAWAIRVETTSEVGPAIRKALEHTSGPAIVELRTDPAVITPTKRLGDDAVGGLRQISESSFDPYHSS